MTTKTVDDEIKPRAKHGTNIRWTHGTGFKGETWNPLRGCTIVSPGCSHCYAMRTAARFSGPGLPYEGLAEMRNGHAVWTNQIRLLPDKLDQPDRWAKPRMIFVNSMSDLFHPDVPESFIDEVFATMERNPRHIFQVLTKRPDRMRDYTVRRAVRLFLAAHPFHAYPPGDAARWYEDQNPHVWLGTSVEDQRRADERIPVLLDTPAAVRFLSCEPLLGPIDLDTYLWEPCRACYGADLPCVECSSQGERPRRLISWVIVGGESGPGFRPMDTQWARDIRDACLEVGVPFYFKQSADVRTEQGQLLDGVRWEQYPLGEAAQ